MTHLSINYIDHFDIGSSLCNKGQPCLNYSNPILFCNKDMMLLNCSNPILIPLNDSNYLLKLI